MSDIRKIVKKIIPQAVFRLVEPYGHLAEAIIENNKYGFPARGLHFIGVTGTNGKTTTTFLITKMLHEAGIKVGMLSTVAYGVGDDIKPQLEHMTTSQAGVLQERLRAFVDAGVEWVVLETSSHSLAQNRVWGIPYEIAVMTNVTVDHLDYHRTLENYTKAKRRLFKIAAKNGRKLGIVNADDPNARTFANVTPRSITYGMNSGELMACDVVLRPDRSYYKAKIDDDEYDIEINIPGAFNVSNSLAAVAVGRELGLNREQIEKGIASLKGVEGRMTVINEGQDYKVIVDFASTSDAFERFFESVRPAVKGKLVAVFGSAGRRDEAKRFAQGEIAGKYCDEVILTEEDDRDVDGNLIMLEIARGVARSGKVKDKDMFMILNRETAINFAITRVSSPDDMVVVLGKGHEKTIERADGAHPWSDIEITRQAIIDQKN